MPVALFFQRQWKKQTLPFGRSALESPRLVNTAHMRGFVLMAYPRKHTDEQRAEIAAQYESGAPVKEIAAQFNCATRTVILIAQTAGLPRRHTGATKQAGYRATLRARA